MWRRSGGGCAEGAAELPVEDGVGPGVAGASPEAGPPQGQVGCRRRRLRDVAVLPGGTLAALGMRYVLDVPGGTTVRSLELAWTSPDYPGFGRPRKPRLVEGQRRTMDQRSDELPEESWREITVAEGSQGPRSYQFSAQRVRPTSKRKPGEIHWAIYRRNLDGSGPRYYLSNAPEDTPLETLAYVGGSRWRIETEFETEKSDVGLDEYETRTWAGWHHHVALCLLAGAFLLSLQQDWGEKMPRITRPQVYRVVREMLPRERFGPNELLR